MDVASWIGGVASGIVLALLTTRFTYAYNRRLKRHATLEENAERVFDSLVSLRKAIETGDDDIENISFYGSDGGVKVAASTAWSVEVNAIKLGSSFHKDWHLAVSTSYRYATRRANHLTNQYDWMTISDEERRFREEVISESQDDQFSGEEGEEFVPFDWVKEKRTSLELVGRTMSKVKHLLHYD